MLLDQQRRYARQIMLPEVGIEGQQKLLNARVLVIGAGGLGSSLLSYLAAAGVGHLGIVDHDRVELSNLARQIIHEQGDIGRLKVDSASDRIAELNPDVKVETYPYSLTSENAEQLISQYDLVADGCDNFATRFTVNEICVRRNIPLVSAAIAGFDGHVMTIHNSPCYQCFASPEAPEANTCRETGVIGPLAGIVGSMQALEVIRVLLGTPALIGKINTYDGRTAASRTITLTRDPACPMCTAHSA